MNFKSIFVDGKKHLYNEETGELKEINEVSSSKTDISIKLETKSSDSVIYSPRSYGEQDNVRDYEVIKLEGKVNTEICAFCGIKTNHGFIYCPGTQFSFLKTHSTLDEQNKCKTNFLNKMGKPYNDIFSLKTLCTNCNPGSSKNQNIAYSNYISCRSGDNLIGCTGKVLNGCPLCKTKPIEGEGEFEIGYVRRPWNAFNTYIWFLSYNLLIVLCLLSTILVIAFMRNDTHYVWCPWISDSGHWFAHKGCICHGDNDITKTIPKYDDCIAVTWSVVWGFYILFFCWKTTVLFILFTPNRIVKLYSKSFMSVIYWCMSIFSVILTSYSLSRLDMDLRTWLIMLLDTISPTILSVFGLCMSVSLQEDIKNNLIDSDGMKFNSDQSEDLIIVDVTKAFDLDIKLTSKNTNITYHKVVKVSHAGYKHGNICKASIFRGGDWILQTPTVIFCEPVLHEVLNNQRRYAGSIDIKIVKNDDDEEALLIDIDSNESNPAQLTFKTTIKENNKDKEITCLFDRDLTLLMTRLMLYNVL